MGVSQNGWSIMENHGKSNQNGWFRNLEVPPFQETSISFRVFQCASTCFMWSAAPHVGLCEGNNLAGRNWIHRIASATVIHNPWSFWLRVLVGFSSVLSKILQHPCIQLCIHCIDISIYTHASTYVKTLKTYAKLAPSVHPIGRLPPRNWKQRSCIWAQQWVCWHDLPDLNWEAEALHQGQIQNTMSR